MADDTYDEDIFDDLYVLDAHATASVAPAQSAPATFQANAVFSYDDEPSSKPAQSALPVQPDEPALATAKVEPDAHVDMAFNGVEGEPLVNHVGDGDANMAGGDNQMPKQELRDDDDYGPINVKEDG